MDCHVARILIEFKTPGGCEFDRESAQSLENHLAACAGCRIASLDRQRFDRWMGVALQDVLMPEGFRARLQMRLDGRARRERRRKVLRRALVGIAASIIAILVGYGWAQKSRPLPVDLEQAYFNVSQQCRSPADRVQEWFMNNYRLSVAPPLTMNYDNLVFYDLCEFQGQRVPMLLFTRQHETARVYILASNQFACADVSEPSGYNVKLIRPADDGRVSYVIVYSGTGLDGFLERVDSGSRAAAEIGAAPEAD